MEDIRTRYFRLVYNDEVQGRFTGKMPKQAASKAFTSLYKQNKKMQHGQGMNLNVEEPISFSIIECTRGIKHRKFYYTGIRHKLDKERTIEIRDHRDPKIMTIVKYKYYNSIKADKNQYINGVGVHQ